MTDNEIIKALESYTWAKLYHEEGNLPKLDLGEVLDLVNRQNAEIKRLKTENKDISEQFRILDVECERLEKANEKQKAEIERLNSPYEMQVEASKKLENSIKAEAVKEFAERLKEKEFASGVFGSSYCREKIDNLVKEMVGEG